MNYRVITTNQQGFDIVTLFTGEEALKVALETAEYLRQQGFNSFVEAYEPVIELHSYNFSYYPGDFN